MGKETSPDRSERARQIEVANSKQEEMDRRRVQEHYDRLRQQEAVANRNFSASSLPQRQGYRKQPPQVRMLEPIESLA